MYSNDVELIELLDRLFPKKARTTKSDSATQFTAIDYGKLNKSSQWLAKHMGDYFSDVCRLLRGVQIDFEYLNELIEGTRCYWVTLYSAVRSHFAKETFELPRIPFDECVIRAKDRVMQLVNASGMKNFNLIVH